MQDFTIVHLLATVACIALAVWLRVRLFGKLKAPDSVLISAPILALPVDDPTAPHRLPDLPELPDLSDSSPRPACSQLDVKHQTQTANLAIACTVDLCQMIN